MKKIFIMLMLAASVAVFAVEREYYGTTHLSGELTGIVSDSVDAEITTENFRRVADGTEWHMQTFLDSVPRRIMYWHRTADGNDSGVKEWIGKVRCVHHLLDSGHIITVYVGRRKVLRIFTSKKECVAYEGEPEP